MLIILLIGGPKITIDKAIINGKKNKFNKKGEVNNNKYDQSEIEEKIKIDWDQLSIQVRYNTFNQYRY